MKGTVYLLIRDKYTNSKQKNSETKPYPLCLGSISKDFTANNMLVLLIIILLLLVILSIFINIQRKNMV